MPTPPNLFSSATAMAELERRLAGRQTPLFLDYDGTLTPIVSDPAAATLDAEMRALLSRLSTHHQVALVSGRDRLALRDFVQLESVYYAGSHGFDISGPGGLYQRNALGEACLEALDEVELSLQERLAEVQGCALERKAFALAVHYRNVAPAEHETLAARVAEVVAAQPKLRIGRGKMVFEVRPDVAWDKGRAVLWLLEAMGLDADDVVPLYLGDDWTDEDAFAALQGRGVGLFVGELDRPTAADYRLQDIEQVKRFFSRLLQGRDE